MVMRWLPLALAVLAYVAMSVLVLSHSEKMIEPDPYAYRASIAALENGDLTLTQDQYDQLTIDLQSTSLGGGIMQWHQDADGVWVSEKNPGYPFLVVGFDEVGALRLAPLFYGALACIGLWLGARRWLGRWGGTFAVGGWCSAAVMMVMAWRSTMPTYTDASLVALGLGLMVWTALALDRSHRARVIVGSVAFFSLGLGFLVRYTNIAVLAVAAVFALFLCVRPRWKLGRKPLVWWALAGGVPVLAALAYNAAVFSGPFSTGYNSTDVKFTMAAISENLKLMPNHLWHAMPVFAIALVAVVGMIGIQIWALVRKRKSAHSRLSTSVPTTGDETAVVEVASVESEGGIPSLIADRWIGLFLLASWAAVWGIYSAYEWTARMGGGMSGSMPGGFPGGMPGGAMGPAMGTPNYSIVRFYVPAMGAIVLLAAWLIIRLPRVLGVLVIVGLFIAGGAGFLSTVNSQWANQSFGGGGGSPSADGQRGPGGAGDGPSGQRPDFSKCPNLPVPPSGTGPGGARPGTPPNGGGTGGPPSGGRPGDFQLDDNGCPVLASTTTVPGA